MEEVGSPIGPDYIKPVLVEQADPGHRQVIEVVEIDGTYCPPAIWLY